MFLFIVFALIAVVAALGVILSHKPVYSVLFLLMNFGTLAALYIMLQAQFLAAVQVIVYAGAIVVLILFVVMLIGGGELGSRRQADTWTGRHSRRSQSVAGAPSRLGLAGYHRDCAGRAVIGRRGLRHYHGPTLSRTGQRSDLRRRQRPGDRLGALHRLPAAVRTRFGPAAGSDDWGGGVSEKRVTKDERPKTKIFPQ